VFGTSLAYEAVAASSEPPLAPAGWTVAACALAEAGADEGGRAIPPRYFRPP
jgi:hypothetical protein